jgi:hypothetical protein
MSLSEEQIKLLLDTFVGSKDAETWREQRSKDHERWKEWIDPNRTDMMDNGELKNRFLEYFNSGAGRHPFNAIYRDRIVRDDVIDKFRRVLKYLLDEDIPVEKRLNAVLDGGDHIDGVGKGLATSILMDLNPVKYATWNNKTEMGLTTLDLMPKFDRGEDVGSRYSKIMDKINYIRSLNPELNFLDVDHFLHIVSATKEGIKFVELLKKGRVPDIIAPEENGSMEWEMEKYLEEFIEKNFERIDFGCNMKLYQDEESSGRQYPTAVGRIDLLAKDKDTDDFIVIELKKGKSNDVVVGQILRYMGWVNDNLANTDQMVRGIVIAKESDEKMQYALKMVQNIDLYLYNVSFNLRRG